MDKLIKPLLDVIENNDRNYDFEKINNSLISKEKTREWFEERFEFLFNLSNGEK